MKLKPSSTNKQCENKMIEKIQTLDLKCDDNNSLSYWTTKILKTADPKEKAFLTEDVAKKWFNNEINEIGNIAPPDEPNRLESLNIVDPGKIRRGKGGTLVIKIFSSIFERLC